MSAFANNIFSSLGWLTVFLSVLTLYLHCATRKQPIPCGGFLGIREVRKRTEPNFNSPETFGSDTVGFIKRGYQETGAKREGKAALAAVRATGRSLLAVGPRKTGKAFMGIVEKERAAAKEQAEIPHLLNRTIGAIAQVDFVQ